MREPARRQLLLGRRPADGLHRRRGEGGVSAVELSMLAPGLIFLIFFSIQAALFFYGKTVAVQAAREGVSQLRLAPDRMVYEDIRGFVVDNTEQFATNVGREALLRPIATPSYDELNGRVTMEVRGGVITLIPFMELTVAERAEGSVERFEGDPDGLP